MNPILRVFGRKAANRVVEKHTQGGGLLDIRYGMRLFLDRDVPALRKLLALGIGAGITAGLIALELPFETAVAALLNLLGFGLDMLLDGTEIVVGPVLCAFLLLPHLLPRDRKNRADTIVNHVTVESIVPAIEAKSGPDRSVNVNVAH